MWNTPAGNYEITAAIRKEVETGLAKIRKILSDKFETKVILAVEKRRHKAEITITPRNGPLVGLAQAGRHDSGHWPGDGAFVEAGDQIQDPLACQKTP